MRHLADDNGSIACPRRHTIQIKNSPLLGSSLLITNFAGLTKEGGDGSTISLFRITHQDGLRSRSEVDETGQPRLDHPA